MPINELEVKLQKLAREHLSDIGYGNPNADFQQNQLNTVITTIKELHAVFPLDSFQFNSINLIHGVTSSQAANIGLSAKKCLVLLEPYAEDDAQDKNTHDIVKAYLREVIQQAQSMINSNQSSAESTTTEDRTIALLLEHIQEVHRIAASINDSREEARILSSQAKDAAVNAQKSLNAATEYEERAKERLAAANEKAQEVFKNANTAKQQASRSKSFADSARDIAKNANSIAEIAKKTADDAKATADGILPNMMTILGIFVGIIIAVVACYLSVILADPANEAVRQTLPVILLRYCLLGHIMLTTIFLFMYLVSKYTAQPISNHCCRFASSVPPAQANSQKSVTTKECERCGKNCSPFVSFRLRYTYMFCINIFFVAAYILLGAWQIINVYYRKEFDQFAIENPLGFWGLFFFVVIFFLFSLRILFFSKDKTK